MGRPRKYIPLTVYLNSRRVGRLNRQSSGAIDFKYDGTWLSWEHALPVSLSLPLREDRYIGSPVVAVFDNLLPDDEQIRRRMADRVNAAGYDTYSLLAAVGRDCVGALQFLPEDIPPAAPGMVAGRPIGDAGIARIIRELDQKPLGLEVDDTFRISIAGAQGKTALLLWKGGWHIPQQTTATTHIFKPQIGKIGGIDLSRSVENEYFCMQLMQAFGLPAAEVAMADYEDQRVLVIRRFDRRWTKDNRLLRLPQEDFCQALAVPPIRKYEPDGGPGLKTILDFLKASDEPGPDQDMFLRAQVLFWLMGATDGHAKNFSVFLLPAGRFHLTPIYDVMSAQPNLDAGELRHNQMKFAMAVGDKRHYTLKTIRPHHFEQTAARAGIARSRLVAIFEEIIAAGPNTIDKTQSLLPDDFPADIAASIKGGLRNRLRIIEEHLTTGTAKAGH